MKYFLSALFIFCLLILTGCGTVFGGHIDTCQRQAPKKGETRRQLRPAVLVPDIVFSLCMFPLVIPIIVDFADGAVYKPCTTVLANDPVKLKHIDDSIHRRDSIRENEPFPRAIAVSTDAMQYIIPQLNINVEYIWNHQAIGLYTGLIQPSSIFTINPIANGQYTDPGTVYTGWAFKLYYKWYDKKRPKHYWCTQLEYKPEWFNNLNFYDQPSEEATVNYTMSENATVYGFDILRGFEYGEKDAMHLDFFFGLGFRYRVMNYNVTSLSPNPYAYGGPNSTIKGITDGASTIYTGKNTIDLFLPTPVIGLKFGLNFLVRRKVGYIPPKAH